MPEAKSMMVPVDILQDAAPARSPMKTGMAGAEDRGHSPLCLAAAGIAARNRMGDDGTGGDEIRSHTTLTTLCVTVMDDSSLSVGNFRQPGPNLRDKWSRLSSCVRLAATFGRRRLGRLTPATHRGPASLSLPDPTLVAPRGRRAAAHHRYPLRRDLPPFATTCTDWAPEGCRGAGSRPSSVRAPGRIRLLSQRAPTKSLGPAAARAGSRAILCHLTGILAAGRQV
jgi:hypothetical protein